jgi:RNA polymerase sigma factor (sigma-70 family)
MIGEWVKAAKAGEQPAWNVLHAHYYPVLYAVALRICKDVATAEDLVQDSFISAYLKLHQLKDVDAFGGWIKRILIHAGYRALKQPPPIAFAENIPAQAADNWFDEVNRELDEDSTRRSLYAGISSLPEVLRSTVLLRYFSGFQSYEEIAGLLSVPVGTVRSRLNQAKVKLAEQWRQGGDYGQVIEQTEQWNTYYHEVFSGMHRHDEDKNRFIRHLRKE